MVSFGAAVLVTGEGELQPAAEPGQVRDWAARLLQDNVPLERRELGGLQVFEAERLCDGIRAVILGVRSAMERAKAAGGDPAAVQRVACECIVLAETKDHLNWELLTKCAPHLRGSHQRALEEACEMVEQQEDEHLYHSRGYCRELWLDSLGLPAILPPPEEQEHVRSDRYDGKTIEQLRADLAAKTGENIRIARFARFAVGEE